MYVPVYSVGNLKRTFMCIHLYSVGNLKRTQLRTKKLAYCSRIVVTVGSFSFAVPVEVGGEEFVISLFDTRGHVSILFIVKQTGREACR